MNKPKIPPFFCFIIISIFLGYLQLSDVWAKTEPFPIYPCIQPNVTFWKKIYSQYSTREGIIHDSSNLSIIYGVIPLIDPDKSGARKTNKKRIKKAKNNYTKTLNILAKGKKPSSKEEIRIASLFGSKASPAVYKRAVNNLRCQVGQMNRFKEGITRSGAYLDEIKEIFRSEGIPVDLAYLPHVESSFNPKAYSKFGASGMWQFTWSTGKKFITVDYILDERRDPILSSHAAAKLLKENYKKIGNWPMALTAYNHGISGMLRAKRSKGTYEKVFMEYRSRLFRFASRNFYSEFIAALDVAKNYEQYFGKIKLDKAQKSLKIKLEDYASIKDLASYFNVDISEIRSLNPSLRGPVYNGQKFVPKGYYLHLPVNINTDSQIASSKIPSHLYKPKQKRSQFYKVQKGDIAGQIAKRHGIKLSELKMANNLNTRATIYVGQNLRIPTPDEKADRLAMVKIQKPEEPKVEKTAKGKKKLIQPESSLKTEPQIPAREIKKNESISDFQINLDVVAGNLTVENIRKIDNKQIGIIRVEVDETLGHYADWLGIATQEIRSLNGFNYGRVIRNYDQIKIPLTKLSKEDFEEKRFEYHKEIQEDFFTSYRIDQVETYTVKNGDNMWTLCHEVFEVPLWLLAKYNPGLNHGKLIRSQKIYAPNVVAKKNLL